MVVGLAVAATISAGTWAYLATRPCTPPGLVAPVGSRICSVPNPSPTTFIANGTVYTVAAGGMVFFQFYPTMASLAILNGSFTTTHAANVLVMTPGDFANFSARGTAAYTCSASEWCFETGNVSAGHVDFTIAVFDAYPGGRIAVMPWFFVMENPNTTAPTNVTWITSLTATYEDIYMAPSIASLEVPRTSLPLVDA